MMVYSDIKGYERFRKIEPLNRGLSSDTKFYVEAADGTRLLLRVSDIAERDRKLAEFKTMQRVYKLGVLMPRPVDFGVCNEGKSVYKLLSWIDGENAEKALPALTDKEQYALGVKAGEALRKIHSIPAPDHLENWLTRYTSEIDGQLEWFPRCGIEIEGSDCILQYYADTKRLLMNRPQCLQHGDFHNENLLISGRDVYVIDWETDDFGHFADPWVDFAGIGNADVVPGFTSGQLHGYFGGEPPVDFWRVFALYLSVGALLTLVWAYYRQRDCLAYGIKHANEISEWFDHMRNPVPSWYLPVQR